MEEHDLAALPHNSMGMAWRVTCAGYCRTVQTLGRAGRRWRGGCSGAGKAGLGGKWEQETVMLDPNITRGDLSLSKTIQAGAGKG